MNGVIRKILIEAGHGMGYRVPKQFDSGLLNEFGDTEHDIAKNYAQILVGALVQAGYKHSRALYAGSITHRMREAVRCDSNLIISLHLGANLDAAPHKRVLWATEGSGIIAAGMAATLEADAVRVAEDEGLLRYNPSVQIELGNIMCWDDMKRLAAAEYAREVAQAITSSVKALFEVGVLPLQPRSS